MIWPRIDVRCQDPTSTGQLVDADDRTVPTDQLDHSMLQIVVAPKPVEMFESGRRAKIDPRHDLGDLLVKLEDISLCFRVGNAPGFEAMPNWLRSRRDYGGAATADAIDWDFTLIS